MDRTAKKRHVNSLDGHVAQQVRLLRMRSGISREELARAIGVSFQQIQKYESGDNRITIGRLGQIAAALGVPLNSFLMEGSSNPEASEVAERGEPVRLTSAALRVALDFSRIESADTRSLVSALVATLAQNAPRRTSSSEDAPSCR